VSVQVENCRGEYVPAIPLPIYMRAWPWQRRRYYCMCFQGFRTEVEYRGHYALVHILGLD
jgi:hypothetical protein